MKHWNDSRISYRFVLPFEFYFQMAISRVSLRRLSCLRPSISRSCRNINTPRITQTQCLSSQTSLRLIHNSSRAHQASKPKPADQAQNKKAIIGQQLREEWSRYNEFPQASKLHDFQVGRRVTVHGFLSRKRVTSSKLVFADIQVGNGGPTIQVVSQWESEGSPEHILNQELRAISLHSPVSVEGNVESIEASTSQLGDVPSHVSIQLNRIQPLNAFPKDIIVSKGVQFPPSARHLQIRYSDPLRSRLLARHKIGSHLRKSLDGLGFTEVETPILFKSTPEGAREFLVPTRRSGLAYALPQSPQQYKQILMSSGIRGYYQLARCFRDEDLRADRQPEFTQLDLEMSFATGKDVMATVETIVRDLLKALNAEYRLAVKDGELYPVPKNTPPSRDTELYDMRWPDDQPYSPWSGELLKEIPRYTYEEVMSRYGVDKPDLRIPFEIMQVQSLLPRSFVSMISDIKDPIVDAFVFSPNHPDTDQGVKPAAEFMDKFMRNLPIALAKNPDGAPVALMFDSKKPLSGLSPLGFDGVDALMAAGEAAEKNLVEGESVEKNPFAKFANLEDGDVLVFQARQNKPFEGGSTALGTFRTLLYQEAVSAGFLSDNPEFRFLWVVDFPMFTPDNETDPGQGGQAGFSATHHPFTAPLTDADVELLATDPLKARADHYDLVVNGVELGGGSRRIHVAKMQEYVMREILKMTDKGVAEFSHLLEALRAGCPPHAGFALGFDRLCAVLTLTNSVRDVIAFPKSMKGEDLTVKSPGKITSEQLETYHLAFPSKKKN
ncbi:tRNA synthetases class II-domain-containing protein [Podospora australis]|uniref:tRNA synthetases class II-domain-containing protein n=1 Tax=Podospora australis TaxID=1536484 RepID=A0AAN6WUM9_9PEZI|nr:tRNA synthetases class II-domain-containing protein [Podospora australis]